MTDSFWMIPVAKVRGLRTAREHVESTIIQKYQTIDRGLNTRR